MAKDQSPNNQENTTISAYKEKFASPELIFTYGWQSLDSIKDTCIVSLDTNVLLAPYKLRKESIDEIEKIYIGLKKHNRLFLSKQAVREFAANKSTKLAEINHSIYERKINIKKAPEYPILFDQPEYMALCKVTEEIKEKIDSYNASLDAIAEKIKSWVWHDPVVQMYTKVFSPDVIIEHSLSDELLAKDLERRSKFKIPPGYKDRSKAENSEGDLAIWHTLLEIGRSKKNDIVFVSEDRKPDWWNRSAGAALIPKYELIHEFQNSTDGKSLHLLIFSEFLKVFGVSQDVIDDVKSEELRIEEQAVERVTYRRRLSRRLIMRMLAAQGVDTSTCSSCGFYSSPEQSILEIHHIIPLSEGGSHDVDNIVLLCPNCHRQNHR
jgi:hypothetical protein